MPELHDVLDEIIRHLTVRQEAKDELHDQVAELREEAAADAGQAARKAARPSKPGGSEKS